MCSDVKNLYPSIPIKYGLQAIEELLECYMVPNIKFLVSLLNWILTNNYLSFEGTIYLQTSGTAMGTPCAPSYANLVLYHMERSLVTQYKPILYQRYLDDLFVIFNSETDARKFENSFNNINTDIQLDSTTFGSSGIFLDMVISIPHHHKLEVALYQKPMNKYLYLPPSSSHSRHMFVNFIRNELKRYLLFNSNSINYNINRIQFYQRLVDRGYNTSFLRRIFNIPLPSRSDLLNSIRSHMKSTNMRHSKNCKPICILNLPKMSCSSISSLFSLPPIITDHEYFRKAFPNFSGSRPIMARKLGKNMNILIQKRRAFSIPPRCESRVSDTAAAEENPAEPTS